MVARAIWEDPMSVRCEGDCKVMEQLGERQDFESELSRLGFSHEAFTIVIRRAQAREGGTAWLENYSVCVTNIITKRSNIYWGGPREQWVSQFSADVVSGLYGSPEWHSAAARPARKGSRPRLVSGGTPRS
jgi:hypothetical protein